MEISVIVPTYNRKDLLKDCLQSLFNQSYPKDKYEIIVVDDGSTDGTKEMVKELKPNVTLRYFYQNNQGPASARNLGIKNAKGKILAFIDSDCVADKNWLVNLAKGLGKNKKIAGVGGQLRVYQPKTLFERYSDIFLCDHREYIEKPKGEPPHLGTGNSVYHTSLVKKIGLFDHSFRCGEDVDLSWRLYFKGYRFLYEPGAIVYHRAPKTLRQLLKQSFVYGKAKAQLLTKHYHCLKQNYKDSIGIAGFIIKDLMGLPTWPKRLIARYKQIALKDKKNYSFYFLVFLDSFNYLIFRLGMCYQVLKMGKK